MIYLLGDKIVTLNEDDLQLIFKFEKLVFTSVGDIQINLIGSQLCWFLERTNIKYNQINLLYQGGHYGDSSWREKYKRKI